MIGSALLDTVPWFLPGAAITLAVSLAACGPVGRALGVGKLVAWVMIMSLGLILSATLTPQREALDIGAIGSGTCDFSRVKLAPLEFYGGDNDAGENVLMFIPLGAAIALIPRSRRKVAIVVAALLLPFAIELIQRQVVLLNRACQGADVVDNLTGLILGLAAGALVARLARAD